MHLFKTITIWYLGFAAKMGWPVFVFLGMTLESTFFPLPSEIVVPPAGHQAGSVLGLLIVILCGTGGSVAGGLINYSIACYLGRPFFEKYGKYLLVSNKSLDKMDAFWLRYGEASTFIGRFVPGVRHLISLPAGMARMNLTKFIGLTALGSGMWVTVLALIGWSMRSVSMDKFEAWCNTQLKEQMMPWTLGTIAVMVAVYVVWTLWRRRAAA
ncbi:MAG: DedA family protein [Candidatus Sumerlaeia bacterium]